VDFWKFCKKYKEIWEYQEFSEILPEFLNFLKKSGAVGVCRFFRHFQEF
jgi:hypothetical protein